jgi:hypothetical protein
MLKKPINDQKNFAAKQTTIISTKGDKIIDIYASLDRKINHHNIVKKEMIVLKIFWKKNQERDSLNEFNIEDIIENNQTTLKGTINGELYCLGWNEVTEENSERYKKLQILKEKKLINLSLKEDCTHNNINFTQIQEILPEKQTIL